jgi:hypothetical protein
MSNPAQQITLSQVFANTANTLGTPANTSSSNAEVGTIWFDSGYLYVQVSNTVVKRSTLSTF